ncbi:MAG: acyl-CoA dehydrogenase family protein [Actinomycetota bacterium]
MKFSFTDEQDMFRDTVRELFADRCPPEAVRDSWDNDDGRVPGLWSALAEMGVLAVLAPESAGGLGMNEVDLVRILEEAGYAGVPEPLVEHAAVAVPALAEAGHEALDAAVAGESTITIGLHGDVVVGSAAADAVVRRDGDGLALVTGWDATATTSIDQSRRLGVLDTVSSATPLVGADAALAFDRAVLGTAAQCVGVARRLLDATVEYVGERHQFGKPVGSYQAVKHQLADVKIAVDFAAPLVYRAAWSVAHDPDPTIRSRDVSMAKAQASEAVDLAARKALQCHGAIGYTFEYDLQLWLKRAWTLAAAQGDVRFHRDRVAAAIGV